MLGSNNWSSSSKVNAKQQLTRRMSFAAFQAARAPLRSATFCFVTVFAIRKNRANPLRGTQNVSYAEPVEQNRSAMVSGNK
jgi:hypothetical protein